MFNPLTPTFQSLSLWVQVNETVALGTDCWGSKTIETVVFFLLSDTKKKGFISMYPNLCDKPTSDEGRGERCDPSQQQ